MNDFTDRVREELHAAADGFEPTSPEPRVAARPPRRWSGGRLAIAALAVGAAAAVVVAIVVVDRSDHDRVSVIDDASTTAAPPTTAAPTTAPPTVPTTAPAPPITTLVPSQGYCTQAADTTLMAKLTSNPITVEGADSLVPFAVSDDGSRVFAGVRIPDSSAPNFDSWNKIVEVDGDKVHTIATYNEPIDGASGSFDGRFVVWSPRRGTLNSTPETVEAFDVTTGEHFTVAKLRDHDLGIRLLAVGRGEAAWFRVGDDGSVLHRTDLATRQDRVVASADLVRTDKGIRAAMDVRTAAFLDDTLLWSDGTMHADPATADVPGALAAARDEGELVVVRTGPGASAVAWREDGGARPHVNVLTDSGAVATVFTAASGGVEDLQLSADLIAFDTFASGSPVHSWIADRTSSAAVDLADKYVVVAAGADAMVLARLDIGVLSASPPPTAPVVVRSTSTLRLPPCPTPATPEPGVSVRLVPQPTEGMGDAQCLVVQTVSASSAPFCAFPVEQPAVAVQRVGGSTFALEASPPGTSPPAATRIRGLDPGPATELRGGLGSVRPWAGTSDASVTLPGFAPVSVDALTSQLDATARDRPFVITRYAAPFLQLVEGVDSGGDRTRPILEVGRDGQLTRFDSPAEVHSCVPEGRPQGRYREACRALGLLG